MLFRITGSITHHTTDAMGVSMEVTKSIPAFVLDGHEHGVFTVCEAEELAREILCPFELEHETISTEPHAEALTLYR